MAIVSAAVDDPAAILVWVVGAVVGSVTIWLASLMLAQPPLPAINYSSFELSYGKGKQQFAVQAKQLISAGLARFHGRPFCVIAELGPRIVLPGSAIDAVNREPAFDFNELIAQDFFSDSIPGLESFRSPPDNLVPNMVRIKITQNLSRMMDTLSAEMNEVIHDQWSDSTEWHVRNLRLDMLRIISRLSARVFVGPELYHNEDWLRIAVDFAVTAMNAAREVRSWPAPLRRIVHWFLPSCQQLRATVSDGRKLLGPVVEKRRAARAAGHTPAPGEEDCIDWLDQIAGGKTKYDPVRAQMGLALASIHTTSDLLGQAMINLMLYPEWIQPIRAEATTVIKEHGLTKVGMHQLQLLDNFLKETQRMKPVSVTSMDRLATKTVKMADGTVVPKGTSVSISAHHLWDPAIHEAPEKFDPTRFAVWRETPERHHKSQLVSTSVDHPAFGHGKHACPGRFFAANETKIALVHILLKYDFELAEGSTPTASGLPMGGALMPDPRVNLRIRRRQEEVVL